MLLFQIKGFPNPDFQIENILDVYFKDILWTLSGYYTIVKQLRRFGYDVVCTH